MFWRGFCKSHSMTRFKTTNQPAIKDAKPRMTFVLTNTTTHPARGTFASAAPSLVKIQQHLPTQQRLPKPEW